jgi:hypothetical protein
VRWLRSSLDRLCSSTPLPYMAPHLTKKEVEYLFDKQRKGDSPGQMHARLVEKRGKLGIKAPELGVVHRSLQGKTHRRAIVETRGRKRSLSRSNLKSMNKVRKTLIKKAKGEREVTWLDVVRTARVPKVDPTTAAKRMKEAGYSVAARRPREKLMRTTEHKKARVAICKKWLRKPVGYFTDEVDLIIDNKLWPIPTTIMGKRYVKMTKVRFHLRTRGEGIKKGFTRPNQKKQKVNPGASAKVVAGIIKNKIRVWHYLPKGRWNGKVAAETYKGPLIKALRRNHGSKASYSLLEDNDPQGYKSKAGCEAATDLPNSRSPLSWWICA